VGGYGALELYILRSKLVLLIVDDLTIRLTQALELRGEKSRCQDGKEVKYVSSNKKGTSSATVTKEMSFSWISLRSCERRFDCEANSFL